MGASPIILGSASGCQAAARAVIPFELRRGLVSVPVTWGDLIASAIVDTGAEITSVDQPLAEAHGLIRGSNRAVMVNGQTATMFPSTGLRVGGLRFITPVVATDLSLVARALSAGVLLGKDLFEKWAVEMDFEAMQMVLHDRRQFSPEMASTPVPLQEEGGKYYLQMSVNGSSAERCLIDTGSDAFVTLSEAFCVAHQIELYDEEPLQARGVNRERDYARAKVDAVRFAGFERRNVPVRVVRDSDDGSPPRRMVLGLPMMRRFHAWFDFSGRQAWLAPGDRAARPIRQPSFGFRADTFADVLEVEFVRPGGPAEAAGLRAGDRIAEIGGIPAGRSFQNRDPESMAPLDLGLADGRRITLTPVDLLARD